jgi:aerobic-type carbon monoxide dehydrogenase small subunit (CoxS/CutS family)
MREAPEQVVLHVDGEAVTAPRGTNLAALLVGRSGSVTRTSVTGEPRAPLCGMGICFECRVTLDGVQHVRACLEVCRAGMRVTTTRRPGERADA